MTGHRHLPNDHYLRTLGGRQRPSATAMLVLDALAATCPDCRETLALLAGERDRLPEALRALDRRPGEIGATAEDADPPALARTVGGLAEEVARLRRERRRWKLDLWELRRLPRDRRRDRVDDARSRFSAAGLAELLTESAGELLATEPAEAANLSSLVPRVLARVPREETEPWALTLIHRAAVRRADALRRAGDRSGAERVFHRLRTELAAHPDPPADLVAEVEAREAYLLVHLARPAEAAERLERSAARFREAGDRAGAAAVSLRRAILLYDLDRADAALGIFEEVAAGLGPEGPATLSLAAVVGRVACLCRTNRGEEAERLLDAQVEAFESGGELLAGALYRGLEARVHTARGRSDRAAAALAACRTAHRTLGRRYAGPIAVARRMVEEIPLPCVPESGPQRRSAGKHQPRTPGDDPPGHLPLDGCLAVCRGDIHPAALLRRAHGHLLETCPRCRAEWNAARDAEPDGELFVGPSLGPPGLRGLPADSRRLLAADVASLEALLSRLRLERRRAREDLGLLLAAPPWERPSRCRAARTRFASAALAELLVEAARAALPADSGEAASLAELVPDVLDHVPGRETVWWRELAARGEVCRAEALRAGGRVPEAERALAQLRAASGESAIVSPAAAAELDRAEAELRLCQGRTEEAEDLLGRAAEARRRAGDPSAAAAELELRAALLRRRGRPAEALETLEAAAGLRDPGAEPIGKLTTLVARARCLCDLGRWDEADRLLATHRGLVAEARDPGAAAIVCGLVGRIERGRGRGEQAAEAIEACRAGHLESVRTFEALLATVDLARASLPSDRDRILHRMAGAAGLPHGDLAAAETVLAFVLAVAPRAAESDGRAAGGDP